MFGPNFFKIPNGFKHGSDAKKGQNRLLSGIFGALHILALFPVDLRHDSQVISISGCTN